MPSLGGISLRNQLQISQSLLSSLAAVELLHSDTVTYRNLLTAAGVTIEPPHLLAVDDFVRFCYTLGVRDSATPANSSILDCSPFAGNSLNGIKLWNFPGTPTSVALYNYTSANWSAALGLDPGIGNAARYGDTGVNPHQHFTNITDLHFTCYSTREVFGNFVDLGCVSNDQVRFIAHLPFKSSGIGYADAYNADAGAGRLSASLATSLGCFHYSRIAGDGGRLYRNGSEIGSVAGTGGVLPDLPIFLQAANNQGNAGSFSSRSFCFYSIGKKGIPAAKQADYYTAIHNLSVALGRSV